MECTCLLRYTRLLKTKNVEFYQVLDHPTLDLKCYILLVDTRRPSQLSDFPVLEDIEDDRDFESDANFIQAFIISPKKLSKELNEEVSMFISDILDAKPNSSFFILEEETDRELNFSIRKDMLPIIDFIKPYVCKVNRNIDLNNITHNDFNYLSQD